MEEGIGKAEEIEIETFPVEAEQPQDTAAEEMDDDYLQDPTTNGENYFLYKKHIFNAHFVYTIYQCLVWIPF